MKADLTFADPHVRRNLSSKMTKTSRIPPHANSIVQLAHVNSIVYMRRLF
jgi:hypothetical protein